MQTKFMNPSGIPFSNSQIHPAIPLQPSHFSTSVGTPKRTASNAKQRKASSHVDNSHNKVDVKEEFVSRFMTGRLR